MRVGINAVMEEEEERKKKNRTTLPSVVFISFSFYFVV